MSEIYFAYGSTIASQSFVRTCPNVTPNGPAFLPDYRLAFTRFSSRWDGGVADVVPAPGMVVWGMTYEISGQCRVALDLRVGNGVTYIRQPAQIIYPNGEEKQAIVYKAIQPADAEIRPTERYIYTISEGAAEYNLPEDYQAFLLTLWDEIKQSVFRSGLVVASYVTGANVYVNPADAPPEVHARLHYHEHQAPVTVVSDPAIPQQSCYVGAAVRDALLLPKGLYGAFVRLEPR